MDVHDQVESRKQVHGVLGAFNTSKDHLVGTSFDSIGQFFKDRAADLRRIVRAARGDVELHEVQSEAWIATEAIGKKRGYPLNLSDADDQDALLGKLYVKLVKYADKRFRYAVRLDMEDKEDKPSLGATLARILAAPDSSDPQIALMSDQEVNEVDEAVRYSYSEATAYVLLLMRFKWSSPTLADHLRIALATLRNRFRRAAQKAQSEPSLFDGLSEIGRDFLPAIREKKAAPYSVQLVGHQHGWMFE